MGVHGLWKLIESSGKPVPLETLENKVLAVDVSIWLYQLVRGFQEKGGQSVANAYLLGLFHRICKLLFYRIKPIFVFDGGVPALKRKTIAARQTNRSKAEQLGEKLRLSLLENLAKQEALGHALGESFVLPKVLQPKHDTLFQLLPLPESSQETGKVEESYSSESEPEQFMYKDLHSIDINSEEFLALPPDMRHDILTELKETRKENSWAKLHLMPEEGGDFSNFQMSRLLKRRAVQVGIEKAEGEMGSRGFTITDLQSILSDQGVDLAQRIAADSTTKILYSGNLEIGSKKNFKVPNSEVNRTRSEKKLGYKEFVQVDEITEADKKNESLTQNEILDIIKMENSKSGKLMEEVFPSSTKLLKSISEKNNLEEELEVNDQTMENNLGNNEVELEHGTLPQSIPHCLPTSVPPLAPSHGVFIPQQQSGHPDNEINMGNSPSEQSLLSTAKGDLSLTYPVLPDLASEQKVVQIKCNKPASSEILRSQPKPEIKETFEAADLSSDSDDFIEVNYEESGVESEVGSHDAVNKTECPNPLIPIEIIINPAEAVEDNFFSDIFKNEIKSKNEISDSTDMHAGKTNAEVNLNKKYVEVNENIVSNRSISITPSTSKADAILFEENDSNMIENIDFEVPAMFDNSKVNVAPQLSVDEIIKMKNDLEQESDFLQNKSNKEERIASSVTEQVTLDAQELLQLFGIPYIVAPMEAEAQCAYLELTSQTQGTITDDSDIWLFGGKNVYKNFFDQKKFVLQFKSTDISRCFHMDRDELIMLALLSGSDYTTGLTGVGGVTALELIAHFPKTDKEPTIAHRLARFAYDYKNSKLKGKISSKLRKISIIEGFPSNEVIKAYLEPLVDQSTEPFSWSKPNLGELRRYAREKFGWDHIRTDKIIQPVFESLSRTQAQGTLHKYFEWNFDSIECQMSKRIEKAVALLKTPSLLDTPLPTYKKPKRKIIDIPSTSKAPVPVQSNPSLITKSKNPAQIARERAAKKVKELKKQGKFGPKSKNKIEK